MTLLFALSVLVALAGVLTDAAALRLGGSYGVALFGIGAAPLALIDGLDGWARLGTAMLIGLTVLFGVGALMADVRPLWHPVTAAVLLAGGAGVTHLVALCRRPPQLPGSRWRSAPRWALDVVRRRRSPSVWLALSGTAVWLVAALTAGNIDPGVGGLLTRIDPAWYVGVALVLAAIAFGRGEERVLTFAVLSLALATTVTPALVYPGPRTQSAAKHIDLVQYILHNHHIRPGTGIFQAYSAFFAGNAWLSRVAGTSDVFGLAAWWPVLLAPVRVFELRFLSSRTVAGVRAGWITVTLVILVDCLGGDYFSPQALGYVLALGMFALVIKGVTPRPLGPRATIIALVAASLTLAVTHELSPFIVAGVLLVFAVFGQAPYWMALLVGLPAAEWAALEHRVLGGSLHITHLFSPSNFAPPKTAATAGFARMPVVGLESGALLAGLLLLMLVAGLGLWRHRREHWAWSAAVCPAVGLSFIAFNSYGNEGIFRAALFGIPWLAILAVRGVDGLAVRGVDGARVGWIGRANRLPWFTVRPPLGLLAGFLALMVTFMIGAYAMDGSGVLRPTDTQAVQRFLYGTPQDSFIVPLGYGDSPAQDPSFGIAAGVAGRLAFSLPWQRVAPAALRGDRIPGPAQLQRFDAAYRSLAISYRARRSSQLYLLWSKSLMIYSEEYGEQSGEQSLAWLRLLRTSPSWQMAYHRGDTYLFRLRTVITPLSG